MVLKMIEDDKVNQHEGSVMVGKVLKELYIDSALKRGDHLDKEHNVEDNTLDGTKDNTLTWKRYKKEHNIR